MDNNQNNYTNPYGEPQQNQYEAPQQNAYSAPSYSQPAQASSPVAVKVLSIVSLVTGIVGLVFCWCYGSLILTSIAAIVTSTIAKNKANGMITGKNASMAKAGKITGIIGLILNILSVVIWAVIYAVAMMNYA